jgi:hypothetical protein
VIPVAGWVAPFGDPGITDRSHLPRAFRSVPRPSSPLSAKASTRCPSSRLFAGLFCRRDRTTAAHRAKPRSRKPVPAKAGSGEESPRKRGPIAAVSHEDTSQTDPVPGTRACPPRSHHQRSLHPSINPGAALAGAAISHFPERLPRPRQTAGGAFRRHSAGDAEASPVVEVNGLEPMTSCLQSRRSPS